MSRNLLRIVLLLSCVLTTCSGFADSKTRVVRLSQIEGKVEIDRSIGQGMERAYINLPVTEGNMLRTYHGVAAVEFEDASMLRLPPSTAIEFSQLALNGSDEAISNILLQSGTLYVNYLGTKNAQLTITAGGESVSLTQAAHIRIDSGDTTVTIAVISGKVEITGATGSRQVEKQQTAILHRDDNTYTVEHKIEARPYDAWDQRATKFEQQYRDDAYARYSPYALGSSDLRYYGRFLQTSGNGLAWQPYFTDASWDPFSAGGWFDTPSAGYGWVSAYPWGWTPYHCGYWQFDDKLGWLWVPTSECRNVYYSPSILVAPANYVCPKRPPHRHPGLGPVVHYRMPASSRVYSGDIHLVKNSAGLGVPRGFVNNLAHASHSVEQRGFAEVRFNSPTSGAGYGSRTSFAGGSMAGTSTSHTSASSSSNAGASHTSSSSFSGSSGGASNAGFSGGMSAGHAR